MEANEAVKLPFLFELGVEEIPHWMIEPALGDLERLFREFLGQHGLEGGAIRMDATPRRLVLRCGAAGGPRRSRDGAAEVGRPGRGAGIRT
jgi:glycyl-tRNA synthetase beta subunit